MVCLNCGLRIDIQPIHDRWGNEFCCEDCLGDYIQRTRGTLVNPEEQLYLHLREAKEKVFS